MTTSIIYPTFQTERLILKELTLDGADAVFKHFADPAVTEFMDIEPCKTIEEAREIIAFHVADSGTRWGVFLKANGVLIGTCGYHCLDFRGPKKAEIGFDLSKNYWGFGYMQEALKPVIDFGKQQMKLDIIEATVETGNARSQKLLEKLHFQKAEKLKDNLLYYSL